MPEESLCAYSACVHFSALDHGYRFPMVYRNDIIIHPEICLGTSLLYFDFYLLYYAAVLLKFTYYAQYYAQEQELWWEYYAIYIQVSMSNSLHIPDNLRKIVLLELFMNDIKV